MILIPFTYHVVNIKHFEVQGYFYFDSTFTYHVVNIKLNVYEDGQPVNLTFTYHVVNIKPGNSKR